MERIVLRLDVTAVDYAIIAAYFLVVLGIGAVARLSIKTDLAVGTVLIAGVNLFALALVMHLMLGWSIDVAILAAAGVVLVYVTLGGLTSAIYNEVLQFFIILASLVPLTIVAGLHAWQGLGSSRIRRASPT